MKPTPAERGGPAASPRPPAPDAGAEPEPSLAGAARAWDRFWFSPRDPTGLAVIRIVAGIVILYIHIAYSFNLLDFVGRYAWLDDSAVQWWRFEKANYLPKPGWEEGSEIYSRGVPIFSAFFDVKDDGWVIAVHTFFLVAMFLFTIGLCTRVTSVLAWVGALSYIQRAPNTLFGMDTMMSILLFYLMIGSSGAALSVDRLIRTAWERRRRGAAFVPTPPAPLVSANLAIRLFQVHFCIIYLASGFSKLLGSSWWSGTAPQGVLLNYEFAPFNVPLYRHTLHFLARHRWMWETLMSAGVVFTFWTEIGLPFLVWNRKMRWVMICSSVLLHTGIGLFMGLVTFSLMMLAMVLAFVPPDVVRQVVGSMCEQVRQLLPARASPAAAPRPEAALSRQ